MKTRNSLFLLAVAVALLFVGARGPDLPALAAAVVFLALTMNLLSRPTARLYATLSSTEILQDTLEALKVMVPMLNAFSTDFSPATAQLNQQVLGHISTLPTIQSYDATTGFRANAAEADSLLTDVPVTLNRLRHVPVKVDYLTQLGSKKNLYAEAIKNQAYVLGKDIVDFALGLAVQANFTNETEADIDDVAVTTLEKIRTALNTQGAAPIGRFGLVNSAVAAAIQEDARAASADFYGQLNGANGYRVFKNVAGFDNIWEYPGLPDNSEDLGGFFGDRRSHVIAARVPDVQASAAFLGIPQIARFETVTDPTSGLTLLGIMWQEQGTFDVILTIAALYGIAAGAQGGTDHTKTDDAGHRLQIIGS